MMFEVRINNLLPWFMNCTINDLFYCEVAWRAPWLPLSFPLTVVFHCKLILLRAIALLSQYCKKRQLTQCFAKGVSSIICGKELSLLQNTSSHTALWVQLARQLHTSNFGCPASSSGSQTLAVSILVQHPQSSLSC